MSRNTRKHPTKYRHSRHIRSSSWFRPSREDVALYEALRTASRPLTIKELSELSGARPSTVDHTMRYWTELGVLKRTFLDRAAWYRWEPDAKACEIVGALERSTALARGLPGADASPPGIMRRAARSVAGALHAIAKWLES